VDQQAMAAVVDRLAGLTPRPTGLFAWSDMFTAALYPTLHRRGLQPGRDIAVVSCNNEWPLLLGLQPRPAIVDIQGVKVGRRAVEQLLWRMQNRREPRTVVLLTPTLIPPEA
jgi:LacI family transcriptional regulator